MTKKNKNTKKNNAFGGKLRPRTIELIEKQLYLGLYSR